MPGRGGGTVQRVAVIGSGRRVLLPPSNFVAWDTLSWSSRRTIVLADCFATESPSSSWRSRCSISVFRSWRRRECNSSPASTSARRSRPPSCGRDSMQSASRPARVRREIYTFPGRELAGVHLAMDFLTSQNRRNAGDSFFEMGTPLPASRFPLPARDRRVVIIGGGDTGSDCAGTCVRQGARSVKQFELLPQPPRDRASTTPWPLWPMQLRTSHAHEEGAERDWSVATTAFSGENGRVGRIHGVRLERQVFADGRSDYVQLPGSEFELEADLVAIDWLLPPLCR